MQAYSDIEREDDPHALPDIEVFYIGKKSVTEFAECGVTEPGWYWWSCFPGCLPDGDPVGPFNTEDEALADARDY